MFAHFVLGFRSPAIKSVSNEVQEFIYTFLAENDKALLDQIWKLVADSAESIKRSSVEAADDHLRESRSCVPGNRNRLNAKATRSSRSLILSYRVPWMRLNPTLGPTQLTRLSPRCQKHELAYNEEDGKKIRLAEKRAEKAFKSTSSLEKTHQPIFIAQSSFQFLTFL